MKFLLAKYDYQTFATKHIMTTTMTKEDPRHPNLMSAIDKINFKYVDKIKLANQDLKIKWKMKQNFVSPKYTTKFDDIIKVI